MPQFCPLVGAQSNEIAAAEPNLVWFFGLARILLCFWVNPNSRKEAPISSQQQLNKHQPSLIVGYDFEEHSQIALDQGLRFAAAWPESRLTVLWAGPDVLKRQSADTDKLAASRALQKLTGAVTARLAALEEKGIRVPTPNICTRVADEEPADALRDLAFLSGADVILIGESDKSGLKELLRGSVADDLASEAPCSVMVCRRRADEQVPQIEPPPAPGQSSNLGRRHTYHYESRLGRPGVTMPLTIPMP